MAYRKTAIDTVIKAIMSLFFAQHAPKAMLRIVLLAGLGSALGLVVALKVSDWFAGRENREIDAHQLELGLPPTAENFYPGEAVQPQPVVSGFEILTLDQAVGKVDDDELVMGVAIDGEARAYPLNMLEGPDREIVNDELAGRAIATTW